MENQSNLEFYIRCLCVVNNIKIFHINRKNVNTRGTKISITIRNSDFGYLKKELIKYPIKIYLFNYKKARDLITLDITSIKNVRNKKEIKVIIKSLKTIKKYNL